MALNELVITDIDQVLFPLLHVTVEHVRHAFEHPAEMRLQLRPTHPYFLARIIRGMSESTYHAISERLLAKHPHDEREAHFDLALFRHLSECEEGEVDLVPPMEGCYEASFEIAQKYFLVASTSRTELDDPDGFFRRGQSRTLGWIERHGLPIDQVLFGSKKRDLVLKYARGRDARVAAVIEDDPSVAARYALEPLPCETPDFKVYLVDWPYNQPILYADEPFEKKMRFNGKSAQENWTAALATGRIVRVKTMAEAAALLLR